MRKGLCLVLSVILLLSFTACAQEDTTKEISLQSVIDGALASGGFQDDLMKLEGDAVTVFYNIDSSKVKDYEIYVSSSGATSEEVAVFELRNKDDAEAVKKMIDSRIDDLSFKFESYKPEEMYKIKNALIQQTEQYILFVVADEPELTKAVFSNAFK